MNEDQREKMRADLMDDIIAAIDKQRVHIGIGLCSSDVIGVLECAKLDFHRGLHEGD
jgi:hypothetical protein